MFFLLVADFFLVRIFLKTSFSKYSFRNTIRVPNSFDRDQAQHFVKLHLGANCLQKLSVDDIVGKE